MSNISLSPIKVHYSELLLDNVNPRFEGEYTNIIRHGDYTLTEEMTQECIRRYLMEHEDGQHIMDSILNIGFLDLDKIVVKKHSAGKYIIVEGNRRVSAIKTIKGYARCKAIKEDDYPELPKLLESLEYLTVLLLEGNEDTELNTASILIQGVRHISGVKSWGPYQQGYLINSLINHKGYSHTKASETVGLSISRVGTLLRAYQGLYQMMTYPGVKEHAETQFFSFFDQAYKQLPVREWLGWDDQKQAYTNLQELVFFYRQIIEGEILAREVRDYLPIVISAPEVFDKYRAGELTLAEAYDSMSATNEEKAQPLKKSKLTIENMFKNLSGATAEDLTLLLEIKNLFEVHKEDIESLKVHKIPQNIAN